MRPGVIAAGASAPASPIATVRIMDATLLDATGDYGDATTRIGVNGSGWVARVTVPYLVGQTFDPTKMTFTVTDPGYDATGTTTVTRTINGTAVLRRQSTANASLQQSNDGTTLTVYFALSDDIYQGSTVTGISAASGFYGSSAAGTVTGTITNASTIQYEKPLFAWINTQHERVTASYPVEAVAFHRRGRSGRMIARIEFIATDTHSNTAATQTASSTSASVLQTQGQIAEVYKATIPVTALTQGDICQVGVKVYPWIGDSTAILDLTGSDNVTWPTIQPQTRLRFKNDKSATYGGAFAYVSVSGNDSTGVISTTANTARTTPFLTLAGALNALQTANNTRTGGVNNTHSGSKVRLMDNAGANQAYTLGASLDGVAGDCWTDIEADPLNTATASVTLTVTRNHTGMFRWKVPFNVTADAFLNGANSNGNIMQSFDSCTITYSVNPTAPLNYQSGLGYWRNVTLSGMAQPECHPWNGFSTTRTQATAIGCIVTNSTTNFQMRPTTFIGCSFKRGAFFEVDFTSAPNMDSHDGAVIYNNLMLDLRAQSAFAQTQTYVRGLALVQNVWERANTATIGSLNIGGDGTSMAMNNIVEMYQTIPGVSAHFDEARSNRFYSEVAAAAGVIKRGISRYNLWFNYNCKTDLFQTQDPGGKGRVGNWRYRYAVGDEGNVSVNGDQNLDTATDPTGGSTSANNWLGEYWQPSSTPYANPVNVTWTNNKSGSGDTGGGTYTLTGSTNTAYDRVASGFSALSMDAVGAVRKNDGHGACGAYERP